MEMRCFTPGARTQPATAITTFAVLENAYITPVARTQPATAITTFAVLENAYLRLEQEHSRQQQLRSSRCWRMRIYAWNKNTAGNSNYGLRGAGECCLVPTITKIERTRLRSVRCWRMLFGARSGT